MIGLGSDKNHWVAAGSWLCLRKRWLTGSHPQLPNGQQLPSSLSEDAEAPGEWMSQDSGCILKDAIVQVYYDLLTSFDLDILCSRWTEARLCWRNILPWGFYSIQLFIYFIVIYLHCDQNVWLVDKWNLNKCFPGWNIRTISANWTSESPQCTNWWVNYEKVEEKKVFIVVRLFIFLCNCYHFKSFEVYTEFKPESFLFFMCTTTL